MAAGKTHGRFGFERVLIGSVADAVVRRGSTPVLLVRPDESPPPPAETLDFSRILVPVDGSAFSAAIVGPIASLAGNAPLEVTLFEVAAPREDAGAALYPLGTTAVKRGSPIGTGYLSRFESELPAQVGLAARRIGRSKPALAILDEARTGAYGLIAMATHGLGGAHHLLLGSTADKVMRGTDKPILLYRPHPPLPRATDDAEPAFELVSEEVFVQEVVVVR